MPDAKSTYYGPGERGLATILGPGPNFFGMVQSQAAMQARRDQMTANEQAKKDAARERTVNQMYGQLSRPNPTDVMYQEELDSMKTKGIDEFTELVYGNADPAILHRKAAELLQEWDGYSKNGTQVAGIISGQVKLLRKDPRYKADEIGTELTNRVVDGDGKLIHPQEVDVNELAYEKALYGQGTAGARFLNEGAVVDSFANSDAVKAQNIKWESQPVASSVGGIGSVNQTSYSQKNKPFLKLSTFDSVGGAKFEVLSPEELIKSGVYQLALNDKPLGLLIEAKAEKFFAGRSVPPTEAEMDYEKARALNEMLTGQTGGASYGENIQSRRNTPPGSGAPTKSQQEYAAGERFVASFKSGNPQRLKEALDFAVTGDAGAEILPQGSIGFNEKLEALVPSKDGKTFAASIVKLNDDGTLQKTKGGLPAVRFESFGIDEIDEEKLRTAHARAALKNKRFSGTTERGEEFVAPASSPNAKGFDIFKNKK